MDDTTEIKVDGHLCCDRKQTTHGTTLEPIDERSEV